MAIERLRTVQYRMTAEESQMRWNGESYDANFDGKEYPAIQLCGTCAGGG